MHVFSFLKGEEITDEKVVKLVLGWRNKEVASVFHFVSEDYVVLVGSGVADKIGLKRIYDIAVEECLMLYRNTIMFSKIDDIPRPIRDLVISSDNFQPIQPKSIKFDFEPIQMNRLKSMVPNFESIRLGLIELDGECTKEGVTINTKTRPTKVIFNDPATIVYWSDGAKTVVKAEGESFDPEKGLAMAIAKKHFGNKGNYYDIFRKWLPEEKGCFNCKYSDRISIVEPCRSCRISETNVNWKKV